MAFEFSVVVPLAGRVLEEQAAVAASVGCSHAAVETDVVCTLAVMIPMVYEAVLADDSLHHLDDL